MINNTWIDGYKTLFINFITIIAAGLVYWLTPEQANLISELLLNVVLPLGIIVLGMVANGFVASYTRTKIYSVPLRLRSLVNKTPLTGAEPIVDALGSVLLACIAFFVQNTGQAGTLSQIVSLVLVPLGMLLIGGQSTYLHASLNKLKLAPVDNAGATGGTTPPTPAPAPVLPTPPTAPEVEEYKPINLDALVNKAENQLRKDAGLSDGARVPDLGKAYYFTNLAKYIDGREIPREYRNSEFLKLSGKCLELFNAAFISYTNIKTPPTPDQARDYFKYQFQLKKDYIAANGIPCGGRTFDELKRLIREFNEQYDAQYGLQQETGKVCDWSIYGQSTFGFVQVGQDWVALTT